MNIAVDRLRERHDWVQLTKAADIPIAEINWLWSGWLARGKLHLLAGDAGTGKTTLAIAIAAMVSTGGTWPDGTIAPVGNVLIWSGEDDSADTIVPRLAVAGADLGRVLIVGDVHNSRAARPFDPSDDLSMLATAAERFGDVSLLIIDPVVATVSGDSHKNTEVRRSLQPVLDLAQRLSCAVLGVSHFSKGGAGVDPLLRITGSVAFGAVARIVFVAAKRRESDDRVVARAKSNIGPDGGGFAYRIELTEGEVVASRVQWGETLEGNARELIADESDFAPRAAESAEKWLQELLGTGPQPVTLIRSSAETTGYRWRTLERAKQSLGVRSAKDAADGGWRWSLAGVEHRQDRHLGYGGVGGLSAAEDPGLISQLREVGSTSIAVEEQQTSREIECSGGKSS